MHQEANLHKADLQDADLGGQSLRCIRTSDKLTIPMCTRGAVRLQYL
jgi:hypothetical protein